MLTYFRNSSIILLFMYLNLLAASAQVTMTKTTVVKSIDTVSVQITQIAKPFKYTDNPSYHSVMVSNVDTVSATEENNKSVNTFSEQKSALPFDSNSKPGEKKIVTTQKAVNTQETQVIYVTGTAIRLE